MGHISVRVNNICEDSLIFMCYFIHNTENSPLISWLFLSSYCNIFWFGRGEGIFNMNFINFKHFTMNVQIGPDP